MLVFTFNILPIGIDEKIGFLWATQKSRAWIRVRKFFTWIVAQLIFAVAIGDSICSFAVINAYLGTSSQHGAI